MRSWYLALSMMPPIASGGGRLLNETRPECDPGPPLGKTRDYGSQAVTFRLGTAPTGITATSFIVLTSTAETLSVTGFAT